MSINKNIFDGKQLRLFLDTSIERHFIYLNYSGKMSFRNKPYTKDPIFLKWRFCNVFRHLDKVSKYIIDNVIKPNEHHTNLYEGLFIARFFNKIETIELLLNNDCLFEQYELAIELLNKRHETKPLCNSAYYINTKSHIFKSKPLAEIPYIMLGGLSYHNKKEKDKYSLDSYLRKTNSIEKLVNDYIKIPSISHFMAYEYITDLTYSKRYFKEKPIDYYTYANFTIGSLRGLKRLLGIPLNANIKISKVNLTTYTNELLKYWQYIMNKHIVLLPFQFKEFANISMRDVEHWLCEFDKYCRIYYKETPRLKRRFTPNYEQ